MTIYLEQTIKLLIKDILVYQVKSLIILINSATKNLHIAIAIKNKEKILVIKRRITQGL
jgi:hypothetical protein